jgi:hypothetical protein
MERFSRDVITRLEVEPQKHARSNRLTAMFHRAEQGDQKTRQPELSPVLDLSTAEASAHFDPLIQGLMERLPQPDTVWSLDDRGKWLRAAAVIFSLIYKLDEKDG